jgi:cell division protein FtsB
MAARAATAYPLPAARPRRPARAAQPETRTRSRSAAVEKRRENTHVFVFWIALATILLAGVVALNVAVLQQNVRSEQLDKTRTLLTGQNAQMQAELSRLSAASYVEQRARQLRLVQADPSATSYLQLPAGK